MHPCSELPLLPAILTNINLFPDRWLHDLRLGDYGAAAKSLDDLCSSNAVLDLEATRRLLSIEKLAAMAVEPNWPLGGPEQELSALLATVEKRLALLDVQVGTMHD